MKKKSSSKINMTFLFGVIIFISLLLTLVGSVLVAVILLQSGFFDRAKIFINPGNRGERYYVVRFLFYLGFVSLVIGIVISFVVGKIGLKPFRKLIDGMNELAKGNFSTRISVSHPLDPIELKQVSDSFNRMAEELGSIEMLRSDFINNFSHEFKTPIVSLRGFAKLLRNSNLTKEEEEEYLDIIIGESDRLASLATNVLNLSHIENQSIAVNNDSFNLTEQIRKSILLFENKWSEKELNLLIDLDEVEIKADEELLNQIWINLIDNAIKYSKPQGKLQINLMKFSDNVVFKISDYGAGMTPRQKSRMFDKFYQGDESHTSKGNGIGLTIVKKIVDIYNGNIHVSSQLGFGTIITVTLPLDSN